MAAGCSIESDEDAAPDGARELIETQVVPRRNPIVREALRAVVYGVQSAELVWGDGDGVTTLDKFKPLTPKHHVRRVSSKPRKVPCMCFAPISQRAITFALVIGKGRIDVIETALRQFNRLQDGFRSALSIKNHHQLADLRREKSLTFRPAGGTLRSRENERKQFVRQIGPVAKRKCLQILPSHVQ